ENNSGKGVGVRLDYAPTSSSVISYYNLFSQEAGTKLRTFNGVGAKVTSGRIALLGQFDLGTQDRSNGADGTATWYGFTGIVRAQLAPTVFASVRGERFSDEHQVIIATGVVDDVANAPFQGNGLSFGLDWTPQSRLLWRTELRGFQNKQSVFPNGNNAGLSKRDAFAVTSIALTF
ncbi:MAG: outer membrane beta-barrel protein, partial [Gemmatimonadaceae bacterium]